MGADPLTTTLMVGGSLLGAHQQSSAAKEAARAQGSAADQAAQVQREALQQMRLATEPFRFGGQQAINPLLQLLGVPQVGLPSNPVFSMTTGRPVVPSSLRDEDIPNRIQEIQQRLEELRGLRG